MEYKTYKNFLPTESFKKIKNIINNKSVPSIKKTIKNFYEFEKKIKY